MKQEIGLCSLCRHAQELRSGRGSTFVLCGLSRNDPGFVKYPRLPVLACKGYVPATQDSDDQENNP